MLWKPPGLAFEEVSFLTSAPTFQTRSQVLSQLQPSISLRSPKPSALWMRWQSAAPTPLCAHTTVHSSYRVETIFPSQSSALMTERNPIAISSEVFSPQVTG